ncbi:hypothetical protein CBM2599_B20080 [Cupriavidus taiwanensis]|uniref:Uncharacterized protein n=1 Tax=Cupriavidus taiwanensis TaxID=164546 RepID=A0A976ANT3_9BURK|nr:hypothetical protein CBM2599_B20080 [Cupriavidus taiwanensis]SOY98545.1 hypothetical protein CBM2600_B30079 [Cupriavidus taiwanensis]SPD66627.1 protein of unknown function [Cupriavidus taiwanensis]
MAACPALTVALRARRPDRLFAAGRVQRTTKELRPSPTVINSVTSVTECKQDRYVYIGNRPAMPIPTYAGGKQMSHETDIGAAHFVTSHTFDV